MPAKHDARAGMRNAMTRKLECRTFESLMLIRGPAEKAGKAEMADTVHTWPPRQA